MLKTDATEFDRNNVAYGKLKEYTIPASCSGDFRITYKIKAAAGPIEAFCKMYKNGVAITGTEESTVSLTYVDKTIEISGFVAGDTIEFWVKCAGGGAATIKDCTVNGVSQYQGAKTEPTW